MEKKIRDSLEKRFPESQVKQRKGSFGKTINFVDGQAIVARLNDCFDADWNFTIIEFETLETGEVLVQGRLAAFGVTKEAFGRGMPAVSKDTGDVISAVDAYKAAATDALKKCATLMGVAAYLYSDDYQEEDPPARRLVPHPTRNTGDNITPKQISYLWRCARERGYLAEEIREMSLRDYGAAPEKLSKTTASKLIERILTREDRVAS